MSGELIKITNDLPAVQKALGELARRTGNTVPALKSMREALQLSTDKRFSDEVDPKGDKWQALKAATKKKKKNSKILTEDTKLRDGIHGEIEGSDTLLFGSDSPYGAIHQLGGEIKQEGMTLHLKGSGRDTRFAKKGEGDRTKKVNRTIKMPARPYLGVSAADETELLAIAGDYLMA